MTHLVLIDSRVPGIDDIILSLTPDTESLVFDYSVDTLDDLQSRIQKPYTSIAIAQHNYGFPFFKMLNSMGNCCVNDVATIDPDLVSWGDFIVFLQWLKQNGASHVDFLACDLWSNPNWVYAIEQLRSKLDLTIRASIDITGVDGNFILESDNFNMIGYYFTDNILNYKYNFYNSAIPDPNGSVNYTPIIFPSSSPGYIPATTYNSILGTATLVPITTDISNVAMVSMSFAAVAVLLTNGNVVTYGNSNFGADSSPVSSQLYNITKIVSTFSWFTALRSDGKVFSWGGQYYRGAITPNEINSWTNATGTTDILLSDVSSSLVGIVDIFSNAYGSFALTSSGKLIGWGSLSYANTNFTQFTSGIVKVITGGFQTTCAIKNTGVAYLFKGTTITDSSLVSGTNTNPITNVYVYDSYAVIVRSAASNTTQLTSFNGTYALYYTIPAGVSIVRTEYYNNVGGPNIFVLLSNNVLLNIDCSGNSCTAINNVTDIVTSGGSYAYLQSGTVVAGGNGSYGGNTSNASNGIPSGSNLSNVRRLVSWNTGIGALKYDNTFVWWGLIADHYMTVLYASSNFPTMYAALYAATSSNIASVYACYTGLVFTKLDRSIVALGLVSWAYGTGPTTNYSTKSTGKNVYFVSNRIGSFAVETTPTVTCSVDQFIQSVSTTFTYYNNDPDVMAIRGRKYSLMLGSTVLGTWYCPADSFTYTFAGIVFSQSGSNTVSIWDTTNSTTQYTVMATITVYVFANLTTIPTPTITSVSSGDSSITVAFTPGDASSVYLYDYAFVTSGVVGTFTRASSISSPLTITGLTNGTSYRVAIRAVSSLSRYSSASNTSNAVIPAVVTVAPTAPTTPIITNLQPGNGLVTVYWSTSSTNGSAITSVTYSLNGGSYVSAGTTNTNFNITGLTNGSTYTVSVIVANSVGPSSASSSSSFVPITVPNPPTINSVTPGDSKVQISLTNGSANGSTIIGYKYTLDGTNYQWAKESTSPITIYGLTNGTSYNISLKCVGQTVGDSSAVALSSPVLPYKSPDAPVIQSIAVGNGSAVITFVDGSTNGLTLTGYKYSLNAGTYLDVSAVNSTITLSGLTNGTTYTVSLKSVSSSAISPASVSASFTPYTTPAAPTINSVVPGNQSVSVYITDGSANGSGSTLAYKYTFDNSNYYWASSTTSPIVISSGIVANQSYQIKVATKTALGMSSYSTPSTTFTPYAVPNAPTITSVVAGNGSASLYFTDGSSNGSPIASYQYTINGVTYSAVTGTSPLTITGLTNGTSYTATLKSANAAGYSSASLAYSGFVPFTVPGAPTITNLVPGANRITVSVSPGSTNGSAITRYAYSLNGSSYVNTTDASASFVITGLANGTSYTVAVKAVNAAGIGAVASATSSGVIPFTVPVAPTITSVIAGDKTVSIYVSDGSNNGSVITGYEYSTDGTNYTAVSHELPIVLTGLTNWQSYSYYVRTVNAAGSSLPSEQSSAVVPFLVPTSASIKGITPGDRLLTVNMDGWTADSGITGYLYSVNDGPDVQVSSSSDSFVIPGLVNGQSYVVKARSITTAGASPLSNTTLPIHPYTVPDAPTNVVVTPLNKSAVITFTDGSANGEPIDHYAYSVNGGFDININKDPDGKIYIFGLSNAVNYTIRLRAVDTTGGASNYSAVSNTFMPFGIPLIAPVITKIIPGNACAYVYYSEANTNGSPLTKFKWTPDGSKTTYDLSGTSSPITIPRLLNNKKFISISIASCNLVGDSPFTNPISVMPGVPLAPVITDIVPTGTTGKLLVYFNVPENNGSPIVSYSYVVLGTSKMSFSPALSENMPLTSPLKLLGLKNGTPYTIAIVATNQIGSSALSNPVGPRIPCAPPAKITIGKVDPLIDGASITFPLPLDNGAPLLKYKYSLNGGNYMDASGLERPLRIYGIPPNTDNTIKLIATNLAGDSIESAVTKPFRYNYLPPNQIKVTGLTVELNKLTIAFTPPGINNAPITGYIYALDASGEAPGSFVDASGTLPMSSIVVTQGVRPNVIYNVRVVALSGAGQSVPSAPYAKPTSFTYLPPSQIKVTGLAITMNTLTISFVKPATNGASITGYQYALDVSGEAPGSFVDASGTAPIPSIIVTQGILPNVKYNVRVVALSAAGQSVPSAPFATPISFVYLPPNQVAVTNMAIELNKLTIIFSTPGINGAPITGYRYALDVSGEAPGSYIDASGSPLTLTQGIRTNVFYNVRVVALSAAGQSVPSAPYTKPVFFPYLPPSRITVVALAIELNKLTITFTAPTITNAVVTGYRYALDIMDASGTTVVTPGAFVDASGGSPLTVTQGVLPNVNYNVRLISLSGAGESAASTYIAKSVLFPYLPPLAPTISTIVSGDRSAVVTFTGQPSRGAPITGYAYTLDASATTIYDVSGAVTTLTVTNLINDASYNVRIAAITPAGYSAWSLSKSVTPVYKAPAAPVISTVTAGKGQLTVAFTVPAANGSPITGYKYVLNGGSKVDATIVSGTTFVITGLIGNTLYNVQMCATNALGDSDLSIAKPGTPRV